MAEPIDYIGEVNYEYLVGSQEFAQFTHLLRRWGGIAMSLRDPSGGEMPDTPKVLRRGSPLCRLINAVPEGYRRCRQCDVKYLAKAAKQGRPLQYRCHAGLVDIAVPIIVAGRHVASMSSGQVLPAKPDRDGAEHFVGRLKWLGVPPAQIRKAYWSAPYLDQAKLDATVELLCFFARYLCEAHLTLQQMVARYQRPEITAAQQFIEARCTDRLTLAQVAAHVQLSPPHFSTLFHQQTKTTFTRYVQQRRAAKAARQLRDGRRPITEICFACGFNSLTHLNRVFRKFYGCAPSQYRRQSQQAIDA